MIRQQSPAYLKAKLRLAHANEMAAFYRVSAANRRLAVMERRLRMAQATVRRWAERVEAAVVTPRPRLKQSALL